MKKLLILYTVILVVLLSVVSIAGCKAEPEPAPPPSEEVAPPEEAPPPPATKTKTYTNSEYGFSVEYPKDWDLLEDYMGTVVFFAGPLVLEDTYYININVAVGELPYEDMTLEDAVKAGELADKRNIPNYNKVEEYSTTIAGLPANVQTITGTIELDGEDLLLKDGIARFVKDGIGYVITYDAPQEFHDEYLDCFELVINSFQFE